MRLCVGNVDVTPRRGSGSPVWCKCDKLLLEMRLVVRSGRAAGAGDLAFCPCRMSWSGKLIARARGPGTTRFYATGCGYCQGLLLNDQSWSS